MGYEGINTDASVDGPVGHSVGTETFFAGLDEELTSIAGELQQHKLESIPDSELLQQAKSIQLRLQELARKIEQEEGAFYAARVQLGEGHDTVKTNRSLLELEEELITDYWKRIRAMREAHADLGNIYAPLYAEWERRRGKQSAFLRTPESLAVAARAQVVLEMREKKVPAGESLRAQFVPKGTEELVRRYPWWLLWDARDEVHVTFSKDTVLILDEASTVNEHESNTFFTQFIRYVVYKAVERSGGDWERFIKTTDGQMYLARAELVWGHNVGPETLYIKPVRVHEDVLEESKRGRSWLVPSIQQLMVQAQSMYTDMAGRVMNGLPKEIPFGPQIFNGEYHDAVLPHNRITSLLSGRGRGDYALALRRRAFVERMRTEVKKRMPEDTLPDAHPARA